MNFPNDTIAAISTPIGKGGIGIIRISGNDALAIVYKIFKPYKQSLDNIISHKLIYGHIYDISSGEILDEVLLSYMKSPASYTREDVVEINCHSGLPVLQRILELVLKSGARIAAPGEFTQRAFLNGRIDLTQAEAVMDIINARTLESAQIARRQLSGALSFEIIRHIDELSDISALIEAYIDFPEDDVPQTDEAHINQSVQKIAQEIEILLQTFQEARFYREGIKIAIIGKPNVGKSSLLNTLLMRQRAIVTDVAGTTRDIIEESINIKGIPVVIVDTAGIRNDADYIEYEGIKRSYDAIAEADIVLAVFSASEVFDELDNNVLNAVKDKNTIYIVNKTDICNAKYNLPYPSINISAKFNINIESLKDAIYKKIMHKDMLGDETVVVTNIRHADALKNAKSALQDFVNATFLELKALHLREALNYLGGITGRVSTDDILNRIFSLFCIGK